MNIIINHQKLQTALRAVERIVSKNASLPILNTILLKTEDSRLKLVATNLEAGIKYWVGAKVNQEGEIAVPARVFSDFINNINDEKLTLIVEKNTVSINSEHYKTQILGLDTKDFPLLPKIKDDNQIVINSLILKDALINVIDSASNSDTRPEISGISVIISKEKAIFAATDSFRLSEVVTDILKGIDKLIIIPRNTALEMIRINEGKDIDLRLIISDNQLFIEGEDYQFISRLIDGHYPDYRKIIPDKFISMAKINKSNFERNIKMASIFSSNISDVKLKAEKSNLVVMAKNTDRGEIIANTPCTTSNEPFEVSINYRYLLDGIKTIPTENILLQYAGDSSPLVLRAEDKKNRVYLIMPLRS